MTQFLRQVALIDLLIHYGIKIQQFPGSWRYVKEYPTWAIVAPKFKADTPVLCDSSNGTLQVVTGVLEAETPVGDI